MKKETKKRYSLALATAALISFVIWTLIIQYVDVKNIGPKETNVGLASINKFFHNLTGVNMTLYTITDWLGLVPLFFGIGFALLGLIQWIKRKNILRVDRSILALGIFYIVVITFYLFFEELVINYRPVLINGYLEASYPSSTTMLVLCVMPTALMQINDRIKSRTIKYCLLFTVTAFIVFMVVARLISGVHWLSDIIGGVLLSIGLVLMYHEFSGIKK